MYLINARDENKNVFEIFFLSRKHNIFYFTQHFVAMYEYAHNTVVATSVIQNSHFKKNAYYTFK